MTATTQHMPQFDNPVHRARIDEFLCKSPSQAKTVYGYSDRDIADAKLRVEFDKKIDWARIDEFRSDRDIADAKLRVEFDKKKPETHAEELMKDAIIRIEERETQKNDDFEMVVPDEQEVEDDDDFQILPANPESTTDEEDDGLDDDETIGDIAATIAKKVKEPAKKVKEPAAKKRKRAEPPAKKRKRESAIEKYTWRTQYTEIGEVQEGDFGVIRYKEYAEIEGFAWQLMLLIEKGNNPKFQSSATVEVFTDGEWKLLDDIMPCNMQTKHTYKPYTNLYSSHFKEDRDMLEKRARLILM